MPREVLDCLIVGGGPAGLTAALYLARFRRRAVLIDAGDPRAAWIPVSHNIPFFEHGISGHDMLDRLRAHARRYGAEMQHGTVTALAEGPKAFVATVQPAEGPSRELVARRVLLATGADDIEPDLPDLPDAVRRGKIRYCPICDGFEARGQRLAVIGHGTRGLGEAVFIARNYSQDVTLLTLGRPVALDDDQRATLEAAGVRYVAQPIAALKVEGDRMAARPADGGPPLVFDAIYSALGLRCRAGLAVALGAETDHAGALTMDEHGMTSIPRLYAAGGVARGLDQVVVAMGHAAVAATHIHNHCEPPTEQEPERRG